MVWDLSRDRWELIKNDRHATLASGVIEFMKAAPRFVIVLVTAPDLKSARTLARTALESKLAACANIIPKIESHYWWQGKLERSSELLIIFKTTRSRVARLEMTILAKHPYDTPEFVVLPIGQGNKRYLKWIETSLGP
jgi:periplasmic divalent cation tolerance protein